jgi:hypothetical protein
MVVDTLRHWEGSTCRKSTDASHLFPLINPGPELHPKKTVVGTSYLQLAGEKNRRLATNV